MSAHVSRSIGAAPEPSSRITPFPGHLTGADALVAAAIAAIALAAYVPLVLRLAQGQLYNYYNLAFDFDASRVLSVLTGSQPDAFGFKHPFMLLLRPLGLLLVAFGLPAKSAAGLVMAMAGALRVALVFLFLRAATLRRPEAAALSLLFAVSSTQLIITAVTETYGFASLSIILVWLIAQLRLGAPSRWRVSRYVAAVAAAGITITNAVQPAIAEAAVLLHGCGSRALLPGLVRFGAVCGLAFGLVALAIWPAELWAAAHDPVGTAKAIFWMQTKGATTGPAKVLETVLGFSFVSPSYTVVPLPETTRMIDFREWVFPGIGGVVAPAWVAFWAAGTVAGLAHPAFRPVALGLVAALAFNVLFHLGFQYRGSLYIYTGHTHFLVLALAAGFAPWLTSLRARAAHLAAVLALAAGMAAVNVPGIIGFATRFDVPDTQCPAPCADGLP